MNKIQYFFLVCQLFLIYSCSYKDSEYDKMKEFLSQKYDVELKDYDYLVVINEQGDCMNCNNLFSKAISSAIVNHNVLYLISSPGTNIDISPYLKYEYNNILLDFGNHFSELQIVDKCAIIELGKNKVDTIIKIDFSNVHSANDIIKSF